MVEISYVYASSNPNSMKSMDLMMLFTSMRLLVVVDVIDGNSAFAQGILLETCARAKAIFINYLLTF